MAEIFESYDPMGWQVAGAAAIVFPVESISLEGGKRIVRHARPYRDGAKLDDTGLTERVWTVTACFNNSITEPRLGGGGSLALYPNTLQALLASFEKRQTGDLTLPTEGVVRARAERYKRLETYAERDQATVELVFVEDNEESLERQQFRPPSFGATGKRLAEQTQFSAQSAGVWGPDNVTLFQAAGQLEAALQAPGRAVNDVRAQAETTQRLARRIVAAMSDLASSVGADFDDPRGSAGHREFRSMEDRAAQAEAERSQSLPRVRPFVVDVDRTSVFEIAARFRQDPEQLLDLNSARVPDPFNVARNDVVLVFVA